MNKTYVLLSAVFILALLIFLITCQQASTGSDSIDREFTKTVTMEMPAVEIDVPTNGIAGHKVTIDATVDIEYICWKADSLTLKPCCVRETPTPTATPTASPTVSPTTSPTPTVTPTPTATPTPDGFTPIPTPTPTATPTATPSPTPTCLVSNPEYFINAVVKIKRDPHYYGNCNKYARVQKEKVSNTYVFPEEGTYEIRFYEDLSEDRTVELGYYSIIIGTPTPSPQPK